VRERHGHPSIIAQQKVLRNVGPGGQAADCFYNVGGPLMTTTMCRLLAILATMGALGAAPARAGAQARIKSDQDVLIELERQWNEAFYSKDVPFIRTILADEFIATYDDGTRGDKTKELELAASFDQAVTMAVQDEFIVKEFGSTAIVWFTLHITGLKQGKPSELTLRYTDVWVLRGAQWLCVSTQSTRVG
jgi:ketosteroid isomerase-like protein